MRFFVGLDDVHHARHFPRACISINRLRRRKSDLQANDWIMDSGAFTEISTHGEYRTSVEQYAREIDRWAKCGRLLAAVAQDWMCEAFMLAKTGLTVDDHQRLTIERYDALLALRPSCYVLPVVQGFRPSEYADHVRQYGERLAAGQWVGVGSVCKRNSQPREIEAVLGAIYDERPDLRLHGFGVKITALQSGAVRQLLYSADSMAWSFAARKQGRNAHDWREAQAFCERIERQVIQRRVFV
jgi:hypothetical protein